MASTQPILLDTHWKPTSGEAPCEALDEHLGEHWKERPFQQENGSDRNEKAHAFGSHWWLNSWEEHQTQTSALTLTWPAEGQQPLLPSQPELERWEEETEGFIIYHPGHTCQVLPTTASKKKKDRVKGNWKNGTPYIPEILLSWAVWII